MKPFFAFTLAATAATLSGQDTPAAGVGPSDQPTPPANTRVDRQRGSAATNSAAAKTEPSNGRGQVDAARQNAATSSRSATTAVSPDLGATAESPFGGNGGTVQVPTPPPEPFWEIKPPPPSPGHVWAAGTYVWRNNDWQWMSGRWVLPPRPGLTWYGGTYDARTQTWKEGRWGENPTPTVGATTDANPDAPRR